MCGLVVHERPDGRYAVTSTVDEQLKEQIEEAVEANPELSEARLVRQGIRRELQVQLKHEKTKDNE